jgi:hypothetical protein
MSQPGVWLRSLAARVCSVTTMERLIDPAIADMQCEHADAFSRGRVWRCTWVRIAGSLAFWRVMGALVIERSLDGAYEWAAADGWAVGRVLGFVTAATVAVTLLLELPALLQTGRLFGAKRIGTALAFLYLIPQAFPLAISVGVLFGILYGMRGRAVTDRLRHAIMMLAVCCTLGSFVTLAWVVPARNQAFRAVVSGIPSDKLGKGLNELTLRELRRDMDELNSGAMRGSVQERSITFTYYQRFALSVVPIVFGLFALGLLDIGRLQRSPFAFGAVGVMTCLCYYLLLYASRVAAFQGWGTAVVWLPNLFFLLGTILLKKRSGRKAYAPGPAEADVPPQPRSG